MSEIKQDLASSLREGRYVVFEGVAYIVKSIQTSRTGKHGHAKCRIDATAMIGGGKVTKIIPAHDKVDVPIIEKKPAQVLSILGDIANVMDLETYENFDLKIPDDLKGEIKEGGQIVYWTILKDRIMKQVKGE